MYSRWYGRRRKNALAIWPFIHGFPSPDPQAHSVWPMSRGTCLADALQASREQCCLVTRPAGDQACRQAARTATEAWGSTPQHAGGRQVERAASAAKNRHRFSAFWLQYRTRAAKVILPSFYLLCAFSPSFLFFLAFLRHNKKNK